MTDDIARLGIEVDSSDAKKAVKQLDRLAEQADRTEREVSNLAKSSKVAGKAIAAGIGIGVGLIAKDLLDVNQEFESLRASLVTITGDVDKANTAFEGLQEFASKTPFSVEELTNTFIKLASLGLAPTERALNSYGNTAGALGKSLNQVAEAVADATVNEFERLKEFGIKAKQEGDNVAFTFAGVTTNVRKNAADIEEYLISLGEVEFAGGMDRQAATLSGAFSNLGDSWDALLDGLLSEANSARLASWVRGVGGALDSLTDLIDDDTALEKLGDKLEAAQNRLNALQSETGGFRARLTGVSDVDGQLKSQAELVGQLEKQYRDLAVETFKSGGAFDDLAKSLGVVADSAPEISKELKKALTDAQKEAQKTSQQFNDLFNELVAPDIEGEVTSIDVNNLSLEADNALRAGDFDGAISKARQAFELLEQMKDEGNAASFELEFYGEQLRKIGEQAGQGQIDGVRLEIDLSQAEQSAIDGKAAQQAILDQSPLVQKAVIQWENSGGLSGSNVSNAVQQSASDSGQQQNLQPINVSLANGKQHTVYSDTQSADSFAQDVQEEVRRSGVR